MIPALVHHDSFLFATLISAYALGVVIASWYIHRNVTHFHHYMVALVTAPSIYIPLWFYGQRPDDLFAAVFWIIAIVVLSSFIIDIEDFIEAHYKLKSSIQSRRKK